MQSKRENIGIIFILWIIACLIAISPWETIRNYEFIDLARNKDRYIGYGYLYDIFYGESNTLFYFLSNEYFWHKILFLSSQSGIKASIFFGFLSIFCLTVTFIFIFKSTNSLAYCLLCINPIYLDFTLSQQRNSFAFSLLLIAILTTNKKIKAASLVTSIFTHLISSLIVGLAYLSQKITEKVNGRIKNYLACITIAFFVAAIVAYGREFILNPLGDRRAADYTAESFSILYAAPWFLYSAVIILFRKEGRFTLNNIMGSISLSIFFFLSLFDFYGIRFAMIALPFFIASLQEVRFKSFFISIYIAHTIWLFYIWLKF